MIISSPDKSQDPPPAPPLAVDSVLPGPPPAAPAKPVTRIRRRRRLRLVAYGLILLSLVFVIHSTRHSHGRGGPGPPKVLLSSHPPFPKKQDHYTPARLPHVEKKFLAVPNNDSALAASRLYGTKPHLAGTEQDIVTARLFLDLFQRELGIAKPEDEPLFDAGSRQSQRAIRGTTTIPRRINRPVAWIDTYYPVMNTGVEQKLEILDNDGAVRWAATLEEDGDLADPEAGKYRTAVPTWHGLSKGGDVTGPLIYVKYGRKEDFDSLASSGVNLNGTIAIVRYGGVFRGLKVKAAQEAGCIGILIYNDPQDDGTVTEALGYEHWPHGPARNPTSVQRGSVQFISSYPGDPSTPGYPAYKNATRAEATSRPSIPSLPISWNNAKKLLQEIGDDVKSSRSIRLLNKVDDRVIPIYNTMAVIPGLVAEQAIIVGNHRDAWVMGAADPTSGTVCLHELVRGLGALLNGGWKPLRTIILASWDGEEYGLVGSTEWGEDFADWIQAHAVAYLNLDVSVAGSRYNLKGSPSLAHLIMDAAMAVPHPTEANKTLWDARLGKGPFTAAANFDENSMSEQVSERLAEELAVEREDIPVAPLGSGSDYTVMLQRLGVASTDMGFGSTLSDAVYHYHSIYDSEAWQEKYADPGFHKHVAVAQHLGLMTLRLADSVILPINTTHYTLELFKYLNGVDKLASQTSIDVDTSPLLSALHVLLQTSLNMDAVRAELVKGIEKESKKFEKLAAVESFKDWLGSKLGFELGRPWDRRDGPGHWIDRETMRELEAYLLAPEHVPAMEIYQSPMDIYDVHPHIGPGGPRLLGMPHSMMRIREVDIRLARFERGFLSNAGIKGREWYRHLGVAPGKWKGYGATPFPALSEAIQLDRNATLAKAEVGRLVEVVETLISTITLSLS